MGFPDSFFARKFNITERDLESYLAEALSSGGDYADLYFEYVATMRHQYRRINRKKRHARRHSRRRRYG